MILRLHIEHGKQAVWRIYYVNGVAGAFSDDLVAKLLAMFFVVRAVLAL